MLWHVTEAEWVGPLFRLGAVVLRTRVQSVAAVAVVVQVCNYPSTVLGPWMVRFRLGIL